MKITIAAINLQSAVATTRGYYQYALTSWKYWLPHSNKPIEQVGKMLKEETVDIACLSEISETSLCTGFRSQTENLAKSAGMDHSYFFSQQKIGKIFRHEGNAIISRYPIQNFTSYPLHKELIGVALDEAVIKVEGLPSDKGWTSISVFAAHLALIQKHREIQVRQIIEILKGRQSPMILAGDFNERNPTALDILIQETSLEYKCALSTYPSWKPKYTLDYIFLSKEFSVIDCYIPKSPNFSDHTALVVKAELH